MKVEFYNNNDQLEVILSSEVSGYLTIGGTTYRTTEMSMLQICRGILDNNVPYVQKLFPNHFKCLTDTDRMTLVRYLLSWQLYGCFERELTIKENRDVLHTS